MNNPGAEKLIMLRASLRCLAFGLTSLVSAGGLLCALFAAATWSGPNDFLSLSFLLAALSLAGFPCALAALVWSMRIRTFEKRFWNAARPYRALAEFCAAAAIICSVIVAALLTFLIRYGSLPAN